MTVLIVEDDQGKERQIAEVVQEVFPAAKLVERRSYQSGLKEALTNRPDIILLDMSLPNFDVRPSEGEMGDQPRPYGGRDILRELARKKIASKVVVVTQYDVIREGQDMMTLDEIRATLAYQFPGNYVATIYYRESQTAWRNELREALAQVSGASGDSNDQRPSN